MAKQAPEDPMVAQAFKAESHEDLARAVEKLTSEEAAFFLVKLEAAIKKRKIQVTGYLVAMLVWILGMMGALVWYGTHDGFVGWVFIAPFGLVGLVLYVFGRWAERAGTIRDPAAAAASAAAAKPAAP